MGAGGRRFVGGGGGGGGGGGAGKGASGGEIRRELGLTAQATTSEFLSILRPYFFPRKMWHRVSAIFCFIFLGLSKASNIAAPVFLGSATNALIHGELPIFSLVMFALLRFLTSMLDESQRLVYLRVKEVAGHEIACRTFAHLHDLSYSWHVNKRTGVVLRAVDRGVASASTVVEMLVLRLIPTVIEAAILVYLFAGVFGSPNSSGVLALSFILYFVATYVMTQWRTKIRAKANVADNDAAAIANDSLTGFEVVKAFSAEKYELNRYSEAISRFQEATRQNQGSLVALNITQSFIMRGALAGVLIVTAYDVYEGRTSVGNLVAIQTWVVQLFTPLAWLGSLYTMIISAMTDMGNLAALLKEEPTVQDAPDAKPLLFKDNIKTHGAAVEFRDVSFSYPVSTDRVEAQMQASKDREERKRSKKKSLWSFCSCFRRPQNESANSSNAAAENGVVDTSNYHTNPLNSHQRSSSSTATTSPQSISITVTPTSSDTSSSSSSSVVAVPSDAPSPPPPKFGLENISFRIERGKTCAIVGATGAGKSTVSRLLFRYHDVTEGGVFIENQDVRSVTQASLRGAIGIVPQDAVLFNDTIRYNIAYGRPNATEEEILDAVKAAQIGDFVKGLKEGLDTKVGERGLKLSGGEKQRVAIARTLLKDPPILVLDEATSALDSLTEADVQAAISRARQGRTVLVIAHRLSTIRDADEILVVEGGRVVERGRHEELLSKGVGGKYFALWTQQAAMSGSAASAALDSSVNLASSRKETAGGGAGTNAAGKPTLGIDNEMSTLKDAKEEGGKQQ